MRRPLIFLFQALRGRTEECRRWHLCHVGSAVFGYGFSTHLNGVRVLWALVLLAERSGDVRAVAHDGGFVDTAAMDRQFRSFVRMSPTRFRRLIAG